MDSQVTYVVFSRLNIPENVIEACRTNFNNFYGVWNGGTKGRVKMGSNRFKETFLSSEDCGLAIAFVGDLAEIDEHIVGHVFFKRRKMYYCEELVWITQLVVKPDFRHQTIAQNVIHTALGANCKLAGLVSSHPYAVLALEKGMNGSCIYTKAEDLVQAKEVVEASGVNYLQNRPIIIDDTTCSIDTDFDIDHTEPLRALAEIKQKGREDWKLGNLLPKHEFLAIVMRH